MEDTIPVSPDSSIQFTEKEAELPKRRHWLVDFLIQLVTTKPLGDAVRDLLDPKLTGSSVGRL